jgi:NAD(P)H-dependent FMN reductase
MTDIVGIVGSARSWGNSELLVRQAIRGAQAEGAVAHLIRLTNLKLESCTGCLRCVIGAKPCRLEDDMAWLLDTIEAADGIVLAAPTYFLGPAAVLKLVLDRLLTFTGQVYRDSPPARPAVTIATAGLEDWQGVTLPYLNAFAQVLGYRPIASLTAIAPGPGEVLLDESLMAEVLNAGRRLGRGELEPALPPTDACPTCRCDSFRLKGNRAVCPICGQEATVQVRGDAVHLEFIPASGAEHRWTPEGMRRHMVEWVMATGPRFMERRGLIKAKRRPFRDMQAEWLCPGRREVPSGDQAPASLASAPTEQSP